MRTRDSVKRGGILTEPHTGQPTSFANDRYLVKRFAGDGMRPGPTPDARRAA